MRNGWVKHLGCTWRTLYKSPLTDQHHHPEASHWGAKTLKLILQTRMDIISTEGSKKCYFSFHVVVFLIADVSFVSRFLTSHWSTLLDSFPPDSSMTLRISSSSFSAFAASSLESLSCLQMKHKLKDGRWDTMTMNEKVFTLQEE